MRIVYDVEGDRVPSPAPRADFAVLALLFHAMRANRDLYVDGEVSSSLLANLVEFQSAWRAWKPKSFTPISIHARAEVDDAPSAGRRAVVAVSGGLDSSYTVLRPWIRR